MEVSICEVNPQLALFLAPFILKLFVFTGTKVTFHTRTMYVAPLKTNFLVSLIFPPEFHLLHVCDNEAPNTCVCLT